MPSPPPRRSWGTRFDSLVETPLLVSPISSSPDVYMHSRDTTAGVQVNYEPDHPTSSEAEKDRSNVEHNNTALSGTAQNNIEPSSPTQARMPHDASVFVASLPSHIPEAELQLLLSEYLSQHATIKHIKLIRDNRGTVCAFVQVESSAQAANLIAACNLSHFMDRHIRCERARAFRTLLVSWRPSIPAEQGPDGVQNNLQTGRGHFPRKPLRLRRCRGTKYVQVNHGADALLSEPDQLSNYSPPREDDPLSGSGVFFPEGLEEGDVESLKSLLEAFGRLEFITPFEPIAPPQILPPCMHAPESDGGFTRGESATEPTKEGGREQPNCIRTELPMWAAKWEHRNDAVSAITALQYVSNLFVCWSHTYGRPHHPPYAQYGPHAHSRTSSGFYAQPSYPPTPFATNEAHPIQSHSHDAEGDPDAQWAVALPSAGARLQQLHTQGSNVNKGEQEQKPITFSESDFPPLSGEGGGVFGGRGRGKKGAWLGRRNFVRAGAPSPPPISTNLNASRLHVGLNTPSSGVPHTPDLESVVEPSPITPGFPATPRTSSGGYAPSSQSDDMRKDVVYPSTQGFNPPYTPAPGCITPGAPRQGYVMQQGFPGPMPYMSSHNFPQRRGFEDRQEKIGDGRELFIGGLEMATWDEDRVRSVFGQYGTIEEMRLVKPGFQAPVHKRAFAFVKFTDQEAPLRAIKQEHLRIYDDRKIKVQLREANPPKRWGGYRGRARFHHGLGRTDRVSLDLDQDSSVGEMFVAAGACEPEATGHVRFASAPATGGVKMEDVIVEPDEVHEDALDNASSEFKDDAEPNAVSLEDPESAVEVKEEETIDELQIQHNETASADSADTTLTLENLTISHASSPAESAHQQLHSEQDSLTVTSTTPPPSNPDASSIYAPSSAGSAQTNTGYYPQVPSWIPPYAIPPASYGPYGYYPQPVASQPTTDGSNPYPWMAALYRNVVPFVPWFNPPPGVELAPAPVRPTGYIQREPGGIFIPVYPPERLGQYMSASGTAVDPSQTQPQSGSSSAGNWQNIPPHPQLYPVPYPMHPAMMMPPHAPANGIQHPHQHHQQLPVTGNGWITGPPPGAAYPTQHAPSSAPPPYPAPNSYYTPPASASSANSRPGTYGHYDASMHQPPIKNTNRRGTEYGQQHRVSGGFGPREGRGSHRRGQGGAGMNGSVEQSLSTGAVDHQWQMKPHSALPAQLTMATSGNSSQWN